MKTSRAIVACLRTAFAVGAMAIPAQAQRAPVPRVAAGSRLPASRIVDPQLATTALKKLPIRFEPTDRKGTFLARGIGPGVQLTGRTIDFPLGSDSQGRNSIRVEFVGARKSRVTGLDPLPGRINYLYGDDPAKWRTNIPTYARAHTSELYRGIDVQYYGAGDLLEYDFIVRPGARPDSIRLRIGGTSVEINDAGDLVYDSNRRVLMRKPVAYQTIEGTRRDVRVDYRRRNDGAFDFLVGEYDRTQSLVIDPVVAYSFTVGGSSGERVASIAVDDLGAVYVGGETNSIDFPTVNPGSTRQNAGDTCRTGTEFNTAVCSDGFLAKIGPNGAALEYATYFGLSSFDTITHVAVDASHTLYFTAYGQAPNQPIPNWNNVAGRLAPDGSLIYQTIIGFGSVRDLAVGPDGSAYLLTSGDVATLSPAGQNYHVIYSLPTADKRTILTAIAIRDQNLFVAGYTDWAGFPTTPGAAQTQLAGIYDGLILRMTLDGTLSYATFLGGTAVDQFSDLAVDSQGAVYVAGKTTSPDFPMGHSEWPWDPESPARAVVAKLNASGDSIAYATLLLYPPQGDTDPNLYAPPPQRIGINADGDAYTTACQTVIYNQLPANCFSAKIFRDGTLALTSSVPSGLLAVDPSGSQYFAAASSGSDVTITKYAEILLTSLTVDVPLPARFGTPITWRAMEAGDGSPLFSFWRYNAFDGWMEAQAFTPSNLYTWTPRSWDVGEHYVCALARLELASAPPPSSICVQVTITGAGAGEPPVLAPAADFNLDRRPDLLWINSVTGQLAMWNLGGGLNGEKVLGGGYLNSSPLPGGWRVAGTADIDGDSHTDLFLQSDTGLLGAWLFNGSALRYGITLTPGQVGDSNWQIRAVGDLNHDGHPDLIWQYAPTGQVAFWLMNGTTATGYIVPDVAAPGGDWEIVGTGDSNRDGERDIFWQQRSTGTLAVWWMTGTSIAGASLMSASPGDPKWRVVAVADIDGDAYSDVIFQHADTRMTAAWYLQGRTVRNGVTLIPSTVADPGWKIVGPR